MTHISFSSITKAVLPSFILMLSGCSIVASSKLSSEGSSGVWSEEDLNTTVMVRFRVADSGVLYFVDHYSGGRVGEYCLSWIHVMTPVEYRDRPLAISHRSRPSPGSVWVTEGFESCAEFNRYAIEVDGVQISAESLAVSDCGTLE